MIYLLLGFKVILPLIAYMGLGYFFKCRKIASERTFRELNKICFRSFLPVMLFNNIYQTNLQNDFDGSVLVFGIAVVLIIFAASVILTNTLFKGSDNRSVLAQGLYRSNFVLFGLEVTRAICGEEHLGMVSILIAIVVPLFNVLAVILFESYGSKKKEIGSVLKGIVKNPLIIASALAVVMRLLDIQIPQIIGKVVTTMSSAATPVALLCLGGTFTFASAGYYKKELLYVCIGRLAAVPAVFITIAVLMGYRSYNLTALMVMLASPAAVSSYTMACEMGGNGELSGDIVVITSIASIVTIFLWVLVLSAGGLISAV